MHVTFSLLLQSCIVVEVPPYHSKTVGSAVQVQFYVCNGKRKRSQSQRFTYLSGKRSRSHSSLGSNAPLPVLFCFFTAAIKSAALFWLPRLLSTCQFKASLTPFLSCTFCLWFVGVYSTDNITDTCQLFVLQRLLPLILLCSEIKVFFWFKPAAIQENVAVHFGKDRELWFAKNAVATRGNPPLLFF